MSTHRLRPSIVAALVLGAAALLSRPSQAQEAAPSAPPIESALESDAGGELDLDDPFGTLSSLETSCQEPMPIDEPLSIDECSPSIDVDSDVDIDADLRALNSLECSCADGVCTCSREFVREIVDRLSAWLSSDSECARLSVEDPRSIEEAAIGCWYDPWMSEPTEDWTDSIFF